MASKKKDKKNKETAGIRPSAPFYLWALAIGWFYAVSYFYLKKFTPDIGSFFSIISPSQYFQGDFLKAMGGVSLEISVSLFLLFSVYGWGLCLLKLLKFGSFEFFSETLFALSGGFGVLAAFGFLAGFSGLMTQGVYYFFAAAGSLAGISLLWNHPPPKEEIYAFKDIFKGHFFLVFFFLAVTAVNLAGALGPEIFYDSLVYHLAVPNYWKMHARVADMPFNLYSKLPMTHGLLFYFPMILKSEITAKLFNFYAVLFSFLGIVSFGKKHFSLKTGLWAGIIFYSISHVMRTSWAGSTESWLSLFMMMSVYAAFNYSEDKKNGWLILSGIFAGLAMGVKYTAIFPVLGVLAVYFYNSRREFFKIFLVFTGVSSFFVLPWLFKNYYFYGNPFYPFFYNFFPAPVSPTEIERINGFIGEVRQYSPGFKNWLLLPWNITMGKMAFSEYFTFLFLAVLPLGLFIRSGSKKVVSLWIYFLISFLLWSFSSSMIRFLMPVYFAPAVIIAWYANETYSGDFSKFLKGFIVFSCLISFYWTSMIFYLEDKWKVVFGLQGKNEFLSEPHDRYPFSYQEASGYISSNLPPDARVLIAGDARGLYINRDFIVSSVFDANPLVEFSSASEDGSALYEMFRKKGVTHLLLNLTEAIRLKKGYNSFYWNEKSMKVFDSFFDAHLRELKVFDKFEKGRLANKVVLYEITAKKEAGETPGFNYFDYYLGPNPKVKY